MLKLLLLDDEPLAHQVILHHLQHQPDVAVIAQCYSAAAAMAVLAKQPVDVLLLDIQLPVLTGLEMLKLLAAPPQVVIISAYAQYALEGYTLDVTDYLLKPVSAERLSQALAKVRRRLSNATEPAKREPVAPESAASEAHGPADMQCSAILATTAGLTPQTPAYLVLKVEREWRRFELASICCFESYGNYVKVWQGGKMTLVSSTLKQLCSQLDQTAFVQVHKSFLVAADHVIGRDSQQLQLSNQMWVKIGDAYKQQARSLLPAGLQ